MPVTELLNRLAQQLVQTWPRTSRAALIWAAVCGIHKGVIMSTSACATSWGSKTQMLTAAVVFCALVGAW